jgi:hypothetical protein
MYPVRENGLSEAENRELFVTRDLDRIVTLVLSGLQAAGPRNPGPRNPLELA